VVSAITERGTEKARIRQSTKLVNGKLRMMNVGDRFFVVGTRNDSISIIKDEDMDRSVTESSLDSYPFPAFTRFVFPRIYEAICYPSLPDKFRDAEVVEVDEITDSYVYLEVAR